MPALESGVKAPEFSLPTSTGETFSLAEALERGPVVLAFFKISCPVCQYAFPYFERVYQMFRNTNVTIVGISQNDEDGTEQFRREFGVTFPVLLDDPSKYPVSNAYGLTTVPTLFLIGEDGSIELSSVSWAKADVEELVRRLAERVNAKAGAVFKPGEDVAEWKAG